MTASGSRSAAGNQDEFFAAAGGDDYFDRNRALQDAPDTHHPALQLFGEHPSGDLPESGRAAVIGGAGGREAAALNQLLPGWHVANVDISERAIEFGRQRFPHLDHHCMSISSARPTLRDAIGIQDLTMVVSVLHWVDRATLSTAIANIDHLVADSGLLLLTDFLPVSRRKNPIRGSGGFFTFNQDYPAIFLSLGTYEIERMQVRTSPEPAEIDPQERRVVDILLRKRLTDLYPVGWDPEQATR